MLQLSRDPHDQALAKTASNLGFSDVEAAQRSPLMLMGTPDKVKRDLETRVKDLGITYNIVIPASAESQELFVKDIMPEFVS